MFTYRKKMSTYRRKKSTYRKLGFTQFAQDFFLFTTYFPNLKELELNPKLVVRRTRTLVSETSSIFRPYMKACVFKKNKDIVLRTDEDLIRFLVPRCLRIHEERNHAESMIEVMSFIHEFLLYLQMNRLCYRFHFTAYKCLDAVFQRLYLNRSYEWEEFWDRFLKHVKKSITELKNVTKQSRQRSTFRIPMVNLLEQCRNLKCQIAELKYKRPEVPNAKVKDFVPNEYELSLISKDLSSVHESDSKDPVDNPLEDKLTPSADLIEKKATVSDDDYFNSTSESSSDHKSDSKDVDDGPLELNLTPSARLIKQKATGFDGGRYERGIPISELLRVPEYFKPGRNNQISTSSSESDDTTDPTTGSSDPEDRKSPASDCRSTGSSPIAEGSNDTHDEEYEKKFETRTGFSKFEIYTSVMMQEAEHRYGSGKLRKKMLQRECEYCGIKCYQFSYNLFKRQLDSALIRRKRINLFRELMKRINKSCNL